MILGIDGAVEHDDGKFTPPTDLIEDFCIGKQIPTAEKSHWLARETLGEWCDDPRAERMMVSFVLREGS
ncbi:MAG: hypothetical protein JWL76_1957 [Thermoleophilia bacterium]|nr:hypothetical protein [Thermoleophilia bacterium]